MRPTVYIETTIPSYYFDERPDFLRDIAPVVGMGGR
jgi:hypothetical protein